MAKITKKDLIAAREEIQKIDALLTEKHESYRHGATAEEAVDYDLEVAMLNNRRQRASDAYQNLLIRVTAAMAKDDDNTTEA